MARVCQLTYHQHSRMEPVDMRGKMVKQEQTNTFYSNKIQGKSVLARKYANGCSGVVHATNRAAHAKDDLEVSASLVKQFRPRIGGSLCC